MELVNFPLTHGTWATPEVWAERNAPGGDTPRGRARPRGEQTFSASWQLGRQALEGRVRRGARPSWSLGAGRAVAWHQGPVT